MPVFTPFNFPFNTDEFNECPPPEKIEQNSNKCYTLFHEIWLAYVSIKDLIVSFSSPLHGTAQSAQFVTFPTGCILINLVDLSF